MTENIQNPRRIIVAPLDWGLGHATRCIPVIQALIKKDCKVYIASSGDALKLLKIEFPDLDYLDLPSYKVAYSKVLPFMLKIFIQLPRFFWIIFREARAIKRIVNQNSFDLIISDNRYGCYSRKVPSIFIGHQINIMMPSGLAFLESIINFFNHKFISKFDELWIPDKPDHSLTGRLSNPPMPAAKWIGLLSRFRKSSESQTRYNLCIILSGPEPQRSILEKIILSQLDETGLRVILVRGLMNNSLPEYPNEKVEITNHLTGKELQETIENSDLILSRSGYSTIMDLAILGKKAVFVPTPGQTEQEYIGYQLMKKRIAYCVDQDKFDLRVVLEEIKNYSGFVGWESHSNLLNQAIEESL